MMKQKNKIIEKLILLVVFTVIFIVFIISDINFSSAQTNPNQNNEKAMVMLDGNFLFKVGDIDNFTAQERAELIDHNLAKAVNGFHPIRLEVFLENEQTVIRNISNNQHILNVTKSDVISGTTTLDQAKVWRDLLQANLLQGRKERSVSYLLSHLIRIFLATIAAIGFNFTIHRLNRLSMKKIDRLVAHPSSLFYNLGTPIKIIWNITFFILHISVWIGIFIYISNVFPLIRRWRYQVYQTLDAKIFSLGESRYSAIDLLLLFIWTVGLCLLIRILAILFRQYILNKTGASKSLQDIITTIIQYTLSFFGIIILWQIWGFDVSSLAIIISVFGVGIGFGLQNIANNFISGLIITIERPIQIGDFIKVGDLLGKVQKIGSRSTVIKTMDQVSIIVPNSRFLENDVINWHYEDPISRLRIPIGVAYHSNLKKVRLALLEAAKSHPDVMLTPRPQIWFQEFGESALNFEVLVWICDPSKQFQIKSELNYRIAATLSRYDIEIPFPQRDLHLRSPLLEKMLEVWLNQQGIPSPIPVTKKVDDIDLADEDDYSILSNLEEKWSDQDIDNIITIMRGENGIEIQDRRYRFNTYSTCFVGQEMVSWLMNYYGYSREEAIEFGQILIEKKIIHHVTDQHHFMDDYLFYRFYQDE